MVIPFSIAPLDYRLVGALGGEDFPDVAFSARLIGRLCDHCEGIESVENLRCADRKSAVADCFEALQETEL